jgi:hypothetical protein
MTTTYSDLFIALAESPEICLCVASSGALNGAGGLSVARTTWTYSPKNYIGQVFVVSATRVDKKIRSTTSEVKERWKLVRADQGFTGNADFDKV